ncbi:hypothetical protein ABZ366_00880 [Streptomyces sp. NPDC005904]|uniref:hypothetical protein n=1 Tax=Streptomyces sp. NPDC005904 TaxID=3154570 RepID=UPI0033FECE9D
MRAQESRISVALGDDLGHYPEEIWDLQLDHLDMFTEQVIDELDAIAWAEGNEYPSHSTVSARTGNHNWGASGSYSEIIMQVSTGTAGGVGTIAIAAAIKVAYEKLKSRSQGDTWRSMPTLEQAANLARSRIHQHYDVATEKLTVIRSDVDSEAQRYDLEFSHEDGRKFGATVGAFPGMPSCTRVWAEGADLMPRPAPEPPNPGT